MKIFIKLFVLGLFLTIGAQVAQAQAIAVIGHTGVSEEKLSKEDLFKVLAQEETYWSNDTEIKLADYNAGGIQNAFYGKLGKNIQFFEKIWNQNKFKGAAQPPVMLANEKEVIDYVKSTPGAIGYVSLPSAVNAGESVKLLMQF